jgi:hypothetical protein
MKSDKIEVYNITFDSFRKKVATKTGAGGIKLRYLPTEKGFNQIVGKIKSVLNKKGIDFHKVYFRVFNSSRMENLLKYGSDRADYPEKRKFDLIEWELYPFRLIRDYFYTNKKGELLAGKNGVLLSKSPIKTHEEFIKAGGYRGVYTAKTPDKDVYEYYKKIIKKYKYLEKDKGSRYYALYQKLKQVIKEFSKGEKGIQPEFFITEKMAMKKYHLLRDDVTFASKSKGALSLDYILNDALKKRVSEKIACFVVYKDLAPIHIRKTKGGFDSTGLYRFKHNDRKKCVVVLFVLKPNLVKGR